MDGCDFIYVLLLLSGPKQMALQGPVFVWMWIFFFQSRR